MIELKNIRKTYGSGDSAYEALKGITLTIESGEFVAIMGPSGSGKSTLMHIIGCLDTPTEGTYKLDGRDVSQMTEDELAKIRQEKVGFVFQAFNLLPRTSVFRNVLLPMIYDRAVPVEERAGRAHAALHASGLADTYYTHLSNQLSGGQIQRVAIARALVNDPKFILADEPTGNLDTKTSGVILEAFSRLNSEEGRTIVIITHEPEIAAYAKRIIVLRDGKIVEDAHNAHRHRV